MDLRAYEIDLSLTPEQKEYLSTYAFSVSDNTTRIEDFFKRNADEGVWRVATVADYGIDVVPYNDTFTKFVEDNVLSKFSFQPWGWALFSNKPHVKLVPHRDHRLLKRWTSIVFPVYPDKENYALCNRPVGPFPWVGTNPRDIVDLKEVSIPYMECYLFDTQMFHSVYNNSHSRLNLQLFYEVEYEDMVARYKEGKLVV